MLLTLSGKSFIQIQYSFFPVIPRGVPLPHSNALYYIKHKKCKVNDVIFPSGCEARTISLGNKNMKIGIFTGGTSVRSKNVFTDISRHPTGEHEINTSIQLMNTEYSTLFSKAFFLRVVKSWNCVVKS